jgi:hypothetical protein
MSRPGHGEVTGMTGAGHHLARPGRAGASLRERAEPCGVAA